MRHTKISCLLFASLFSCSQAAYGVTITEVITYFLAGFVPVSTVGTLVKIRTLRNAPPGAINNQTAMESQEFKNAVEKIVADELKKKRRAHTRGNNSQRQSTIATSTSDNDIDGSKQPSVPRAPKDHPSTCNCCNRRMGANP